jgi:hypothetical protein
VPNKGRPENLLRGPKPGDHAKRLSAAGIKARAEQFAEMDQTEALARADPEAVLLELYVRLSRALIPLVRELEKHPKAPDRNLIDALRELRQTGVQVLEILAARGNVAGPERIFAALEERLGAANLGAGPSPFVEHPSRPG